MPASSDSGNHASQDYQTQLLLLERGNQGRLMRARQEQDSKRLDQDERSLPDQRAPHTRQSDLRYRPFTARAPPIYGHHPSSSECSSPWTFVDDSPPALDPSFTRQINDGPSYPPSTGVSNLPRPIPQQSFRHAPNTDTIQPNYTSGYRDGQYPPIPQARPFPLVNFSRGNALTPSTLVPEPYFFASSESDFGRPFISSVESMVFGPLTPSTAATKSSRSSNYTESSNSRNSSASAFSTGSMDSTESSDTFDTVDVETPGGQWDELALTDNSGFKSSFEAFMDPYSNSTDFLLAEPNSMEQFIFTAYPESLLPPPSTTNNGLCLSTKVSSQSNLNSPPSQLPTDGNVDLYAKIYSVEPAETISEKFSTSSGSSNVTQGDAQGGSLHKPMASENATQGRDIQIPIYQDLGIAYKHHCDDNKLLRIEALPLSRATKSVINTTPRQDLTYDQRQPPSPSPSFRAGSETCSWLSDNETDWGDDESDSAHRTISTLVIEESNISGENELSKLVARPVLSKMKQELVDRIMVEFWQIFNKEKEANIYEDTILRSDLSQHCQEQYTSHGAQQYTAPVSKPSMKLDAQGSGTDPTGSQNGQRKRRSQDDENDENEKRTPKRLKSLLSPPQNQDDARKFACPYRKHNAKKYCVRHWRSCALTPLETVARVKAHLYRHHRIFPCQRCRKLFNDQQGVNGHLMEPEGCKLIEAVQHDGITNEMVDKLRSKKKAHRDQSEEDRWREIYQILFPEDMVPSPYFEEIQEDVIQSPDSQELADYEEYCRRELPRVFRASLEEVVNNNTQPLEEQLRSQLMELIRDAQDRVFSSYRSSSAATGTPARGAPGSSQQSNNNSSLSQAFATSPMRSQPTRVASSMDRSQARLPPFFQPPSPKNHLESGLDMSDPDMAHSKPRKDRSDSGYESGSFVMASTLPEAPGESSVDTSASSSQPLLPRDGSLETTGHADTKSALKESKLESNAEAITSAANDYQTSSLYLLHNPFDLELDPDLLKFYTNDEYENCDFSQNSEGLF